MLAMVEPDMENKELMKLYNIYYSFNIITRYNGEDGGHILLMALGHDNPATCPTTNAKILMMVTYDALKCANFLTVIL